MFTFIKKILKRPTVDELPKEQSLGDKIYQRVIDDLKKYPAPEWKHPHLLDSNDRWVHPYIPYKLKELHYNSMEPEDVPFDLLDGCYKHNIMKLWRSQLQAHQDTLEKEKFDKFLADTGLT